MDLRELFEKLSYGELSNLSIGENGKGTIAPAQRPKIVHYVNDALLKLYSRFILKETDLLLELYPHITFYHFLPKYSQNYVPKGLSDTEPCLYIIDSPGKPFKDDVIKVLGAFNQFGHPLFLNDAEQRTSVFTPQVKTLQVPNPVRGEFLSVQYQQRHPILIGELSETIDCPAVLEGALTSYIAGKVYSHMNSAESSAKAQEFMAAYEATCAGVVDMDLVNSSVSQSNERFGNGGWI